MSIIIPANTLAAGGFNIDNSCRFNDASPDILKNGTESDGNRKVWTISMWIKRSKLGVRQSLWSWGSNSNSTGELYIDANDFLVLSSDNQQGSSNEVAGVLRDTSAWYHIVWRCDVTESNNIDRWRCYINGVQRLLTDAASVSNADGEINKNGTHQNWIGGAARSLQSGNAVYPFGGYIAEAVFIDGQALAPTSFGEFDEDSGIWKPIDVSGLTFGDEGVYLNFQNASELGTDVSGNGNTYAETGLTAVEQSTDTCTNNFITMNPLDSFYSESTFSEGNLKIVSSSGNYSPDMGTIGLSNGKWFWEVKIITTSTEDMIGITGNQRLSSGSSTSHLGGMPLDFAYNSYAKYYTNNGNVSYGDTFGNNDIIGVALDLDSSTNTIQFYKNGSAQGSKNITNVSSTENGFYHVSAGDFTSGASMTFSSNFGSPPYAISSGNADGNGFGNFEFAVPSGYFAICTKNLAEYG